MIDTGAGKIAIFGQSPESYQMCNCRLVCEFDLMNLCWTPPSVNTGLKGGDDADWGQRKLQFPPVKCICGVTLGLKIVSTIIFVSK